MILIEWLFVKTTNRTPQIENKNFLKNGSSSTKQLQINHDYHNQVWLQEPKAKSCAFL